MRFQLIEVYLEFFMLNWLFIHTPLSFLTQSLWRDEAFSYLLAKKKFVEIVLLSAKDFTPPLHPILLHLWINVFGSSEVALRSLSLVFFSATVCLCFIFMEEIFKLSAKKNFIYILLFLLNPFLVNYAFEARAYALLTFLATLSYFAYLKKLAKVYVFSTILGLYTHYFMVFVVLSQFFHNLIFRKKSKKYEQVKKMVLKPFLFFIPWFILVLSQKNFFNSSFWIDKSGLNTFLNILGIIYTGFEKNVFWVSLILLVLILLSVKKVIKKNRADENLYTLLILWGISIPILMAVISIDKPIFFPRYFIFSTVGLLLFLVYLIERSKRNFRIIAYLILILIAIFFQIKQLGENQKQDFRKMTSEIKVLANPDDPIYVTSELDFFTAKYYFPQHQVYIYNKSYELIPDYVGKVLIAKSDLVSTLPFYPKKAFIIKRDATFDIRSLF